MNYKKYPFRKLTQEQKKFVAAHPKLFVLPEQRLVTQPKLKAEPDLDKIVLAILSELDNTL